MIAMIKKIVLLAFLSVLAVSLFGCNMISGLGRDISGAADTVEGWFTKP
jgi:predicted small secreted protein